MNKNLLSPFLAAFLVLVGVASVRAQSAFFQAVTNLNPAAYWPMQETVPPPAADIETNWGSLGAVANAYYSSTNIYRGFNPGTSDGVTSDEFLSSSNGAFLAVPMTSTLVSVPVGPFSVETWIFPTNASQLVAILNQTGPLNTAGLNGANSAGGWSLNQNFLPSLGSSPDANSLVGWSFHVFNGVGATGGAEADATMTFALNQWYHIVGVFDGTNCWLYVNGVNATTYQIPMTGSYVRDTWSPLTIGCGRGLNNNRFGGAINEVAIYTNALTAAQISNHYGNQGTGNYFNTIIGDNPYMYWRLDAPAYTYPANTAFPAVANYGSVNAGGVYLSGCTPGVPGPSYSGLGSMTNAVAFNGIGTDLTNGILCFSNGLLPAVNVADSGILITNTDNSLNLKSNNITAMVWFKANPADVRFQNMFGHSDQSWRLAFDGTAGKVHWNPGEGGELTSFHTFNDGQWHFAVGVYTNTGAFTNGSNFLYVDGNLEASGTVATGATGSTRGPVIGGAPDYTANGNGTAGYNQRYFSGSLAHAAYLTNALSGPQVDALYTTAGGTVPPPYVTGQPITGRTVAGGAGTYIFFGVLASGTAPLGYQWYYNSSSNYTGATALVNGSKYTFATTLQVTVTNLDASDSGYYFCVITNNYGSVTSSLASFVVDVAPALTAQSPASGSLSLFPNQSATLSVTAVGATPLVYQWYTNGVADTTAGIGATYAVSSVQTAQSGETFECVVTNLSGSVTGAVDTLTVTPYPASLTASTFGSYMLSLSPTAYWPMHESAPSALADIETNLGSAGAVGNAFYSDWVNPVVGKQVPGAIAGDPDTAVTFYNTNTDCLIVPHVSPLNTIRGPFTLEAWIKPFTDNTDGTSYQVIMGQGGAKGLNGSTSLGGFALQYAGTSSTFSLVIWNGTATAYEQKTTASYPPGVWYHLVCTFDGTNVEYYVNDSQAGYGTLQSGTPMAMNPDYWSPLTIGAGRWGNSGSAQPFIGSMDEVAVYTNVLTTTQIGNHYTAGTTSGGNYKQVVLGDNPLFYYRMDAPAYTAPPASTWPALTNYGTLALNGAYHPGATPGGAAGPSESGLPFTGLSATNAMQGNGVCSFADAGIAAAVNPGTYTSFSYTAWFRGHPCDDRSFNCIMAANDSTWRAQINSSGLPQIHGNADVSGPTAVNDGNWHQFVLTAQGVLTNGTSGVFTNLLYIDGNLVKSSLNLGSNNPAAVPAEVLIGDEANNTNTSLSGAGRSFAGDICEAAFFNGTVLSSNQVRLLYNSAGVPPFFTTLPVASTNNQGTGFTNSIAVNGSTPIAVQWYQNGAPLAGQTNLSLTYASLLPSNAGSYYVVVTNASGSVTSSVVTLTINSIPTILSQLPVAYTNTMILYAGASPTYSVTANGAIPLYYHWYSNSVQVAGATNAAATLTNVQAGALNVYCVVSNFVGSTTSMVWNASVLAAPSAPFPQAVLAAGPAGYWRLNEADDGLGDNNDGQICHDYAGGNDGIYTNTVLGNAGYDPTTDPTETSAAFAYANPNNCDANSIQGIDFACPSGTNGEFTVCAWAYGQSVTGTAGIVSKGYYYGEEFDLDCGNGTDYRFEVRSANGTVYNANSTMNASGNNQWHFLAGVCDEANGLVSFYIDGNLAGTASIPPLSGITNSSTVPIIIGSRPTSATSGANNQFGGYVNDVAIFRYAMSQGQVQSLYAASGVPPFFTAEPSSTGTASAGATLTVAAGVGGTAPLTNQWWDATTGLALPGQTNANLVISNVPGVLNGDQVYLSVTNLYGTTNSSYVTLSINTNPPQIFSDLPAQVPVISGKAYTYSIGVSGAAPLQYQWYSGASPVAGQTGATFTVTAGAPGADATYQVVITNFSGSATSLVSTLIPIPQLTNFYATNVLAVVSQGPVGYWPLQETNPPAPANVETNYGSLGPLCNAYYAVTNSTNATFGLPGVTQDGDFAAEFYGLNGTIVPSFAFVPRVSPGLTLQPPLTLECWINSSSTSFGDLIGEGGSGFDSPSGGGNAGGIRLSYSGSASGANLQLYVFTGVGINRPSTGTSGNPITLGAWHHCVATYDGTNVQMYIDGTLQLDDTTTLAPPNNMVPDYWTPLTIGAGFWQGAGPIRGFSGTEDEVAIYTNILPASSVMNHYLAGTTVGSNYVRTVQSDNPLLYYHMDLPAFVTNAAPGACPQALNYGSAPENGYYPSGTRPGSAPGLYAPGFGTNDVAAAINGYISGVDAGYDPSFNPTGAQPFTALTWFKSNPGDGRIQTLMSHGANWTLNLDGTTGDLVWTTAGSVVSTNVYNDGFWHLAAGVFTGTKSYLYVDGALNASNTVSGSLTGDPGHDLYLGGNASAVQVAGAETFFAGSLMQAAFYTNALTAAQIQQLYAAAVTSPAPPSVRLAPAGANVVITFTGTLQSAPAVTGPYTDLPGISSPYTVPATNAQQYFRAHN